MIEDTSITKGIEVSSVPILLEILEKDDVGSILNWHAFMIRGPDA